MERERLLQEEYEFRLRRLTKENEILAKKFRLFVLVTVAFILVAALSFAIMLCVKMLLLG
jgi:capsular polysaccharide biosynthesis protein